MAAVCLAALVGPAPPALAGPRTVSINLCTDQLLVGLADRDQILGLSPFSRDAVRSGIAREAADLPVLSGTAEEVLVLRPDLVLAGRFTRRATRETLGRYRMRVVIFDAARSLDEAVAQLRQAGTLLGHPERAEAAVARIEAAVTRARRAAGPDGAGRRRSVLPLQRRGWVPGGGTLLGSILDVVGLANAGGTLNRGLGGYASLEAIVRLRPDMLLVSETGSRAEDQGSALLDHPAIARLYPPDKRIALPDAPSVFCGGPGLAEAIDRLAARLERAR